MYIYTCIHTYMNINIYKTTTPHNGQVHRTGVAKSSDTLSSYLRKTDAACTQSKTGIWGGYD